MSKSEGLLAAATLFFAGLPPPTVISVALASSPASSCPARAVRLAVDGNLAEIVQQAPDGAEFCLASGTHRMQMITPKSGQSFFGEPGAILNGSRLLAGFSYDGRHWVVGDQEQNGQQRPDVPCVAGRPRCGLPEAVFIDDHPLIHVDDRMKVVDGTFFLDYEGKRLYLGSDPTGRRVEAGVTPAAFVGGAQDVSISNLVVEKYASPAQTGAIGFYRKSLNWIIRDTEVRLNSAVGIMVGGGSQVVRSQIHDNGNLGAGCDGTNVLFADNDIARNGNFSGIDSGWEGGGVKCGGSDGLVFRRNRVEANTGPGLWADTDNIRTLYEDNIIVGNSSTGIFHEISYDAVIQRNYIFNNGRNPHAWLGNSGILLQNSRNVLVQGNLVVAFTGNGISLVQQNRGNGRLGPYVTRNNKVTGNIVVSMTTAGGKSGIVADHDPDGAWNGNNVFAGNIYQVVDLGAPYWASRGKMQPWAEYLTVSGQDVNSALLSLPNALPEFWGDHFTKSP